MFFSLAEIRSGVCSGEGREERRNGENEEKCYEKREKNDNGVKCLKNTGKKGKNMESQNLSRLLLATGARRLI